MIVAFSQTFGHDFPTDAAFRSPDLAYFNAEAVRVVAVLPPWTLTYRPGVA
jgi:hypothetical protein